MAKYSPDQLRVMANVVMNAQDSNDPRAVQLYITVAQRTGIPPLNVRERIIALANGPIDVK